MRLKNHCRAWALSLSLLVLGQSLSAAPDGVQDGDPADRVTGLRLPEGFEAQIFSEGMGPVRHMAVAENGWVYAALMRPEKGYGGVALSDTDGDGQADETHYFAEGLSGTGIHLIGDWLYYGANDAIVRFKISTDSPVPTGAGEVVVTGFPEQRQHASKPITFDSEGRLYVNSGVNSNNCMQTMRTRGSPGQDPCPLLDYSGGIWVFPMGAVGQDFLKDGVRYSTGHRHVNAFDWNPRAEALYMVQHGRDQLSSFFPDLYSEEDSAELPAEEFHRVEEGDDFGWPYSYFDARIGARMVSPEYGGDGKTVSDRGKLPLIGFPAHWAPNDLLFRRSETWPNDWQKGAYIAFHGSWNRAPFPQQGYRIAYVPMNEAGEPEGNWVTFADGFPNTETVRSPRDAKSRPTGLAEGPDGALYVASSVKGGRIFRITFSGERGDAQ